MNFLAFLSVKFREIWRIGSNHFTLVGARFLGKSIRPRFFAVVKDINLKKSEKTAFTNYTFFVFKIRIPQGAMRCENLEDFTAGNLRKSQIRPQKKQKKNTSVWALFHNSTLKAKILTEMIVNQHIIIAYYI